MRHEDDPPFDLKDFAIDPASIPKAKQNEEVEAALRPDAVVLGGAAAADKAHRHLSTGILRRL